MQKAFDGDYDIYGSDVICKEMGEIADLEKKRCVEGLYYATIKNNIVLKDSIIARAKKITEQANIKAYDSLHLASAESCVDVLLTTDIKFQKACRRLELGITVENPIEFVMKENGNECDD